MGAALKLQTGVDLVEIPRIAAVLERHGQRFLDRIYTPAEQARARGRPAELAVRFAAKEATMKALGTGRRGVGWREVEVLSDPRGRPLLHLHGRAAARAAELGFTGFAVSLSHERSMAIAMVVAWGKEMDVTAASRPASTAADTGKRAEP
jgi:holo-[acyl-carrier protein] synthase